MVLNRISNIFDDIENGNAGRRIDMYFQELEVERLHIETLRIMSIEIATESFWMDIEEQPTVVEGFGLECICGHIEDEVWDTRQCSSCGVIIEIGDIDIDGINFQ